MIKDRNSVPMDFDRPQRTATGAKSKMKTEQYPSPSEDNSRLNISRPPYTHDRFINGRLLESKVHMLKLAKLKATVQQLQDTLKESRDFFEYVPVGHLAISNQGEITEVNQTAASMLGFERNDCFIAILRTL